MTVEYINIILNIKSFISLTVISIYFNALFQIITILNFIWGLLQLHRIEWSTFIILRVFIKKIK